ncbi:MAG: 4Fe-4S binding protein [Nitrospirae bacterium]|nr:4Fe-4S binding protein [Nitrospirota bacterium]
MKRLRIAALIITIASLTAGFFFSPEKRIDESAYLNEVAPEVNFGEKKGMPPHYGPESGITAFNTYDIVPSIRGYAGPIRLLIALNSRGDITGIRILEHRETKNYVQYMLSHEYLKQFTGKNVNDPFEIDKDIDAISRATESVQALTKTVRESSRKVASQVYGLEVKGPAGGKQSGIGWILYLLLFLAAVIFYFVTRKTKVLLRSRDICLVPGIAVIGVYLATPFSILHIFNLVLLRMSSSALWYVIVISALISIAIAGRFYCGWLCPFGALAEFIGRIPSRKWEIAPETDERWRRLKYFLLCLITAVVFTTRHTEYGNYETYITLFSFHGNALTWSLVALMLIINVRVERFWCRYLCPVAAFTGLLSRKDRRYISRKDCPMANKHNPLISECIRCNKCYIGK